MKKVLAILLAVFIVFGFVACKSELEEKSNAILEKDGSYKFLFVGNSYTSRNDLDKLFSEIMKSAGYDVTVVRKAKGSQYLIDTANPEDEFGLQVEQELANGYDFVILQEQSTCAAINPGKYYTAVRALDAKIKASGAQTIIYGTWGRKEGNGVLAANDWTPESMMWKLAAAFEAIGTELDLPVAQVGMAFYDVYTHETSIELYDEDKYHPTLEGSYLAALTLFAKITGINPQTVGFDSTLEFDVASVLKTAAYNAVFRTPVIPNLYKLNSEGVVYDPFVLDYSKMSILESMPSDDKMISVLKGGSYPNGKAFSGILGDKNQIASTCFSTTGLTKKEKEDIADIRYGVSVIGLEKMTEGAKGVETAVENLVNGHWGSSMMCALVFDDSMYDIDGTINPNGNYRALITLNFGSVHTFDAFGFSSGNLLGFPGAAEVFVSSDGNTWTRVPTACWDAINGNPLTETSGTIKDPWNNNKSGKNCLFDMAGAKGKYIRIGVVTGRYDDASYYNTINTREALAYGTKN